MGLSKRTSGNHSQQKIATNTIQNTLNLFLVSALGLCKVSMTVVMGRLMGYSIEVGFTKTLRIIPATPYPMSCEERVMKIPAAWLGYPPYQSFCTAKASVDKAETAAADDMRTAAVCSFRFHGKGLRKRPMTPLRGMKVDIAVPRV